MNLRQVKEKLAAIKPFVVYDFFGIRNCLAIDNPNIKDEPTIPFLPLSISTNPPTMEHIVESEQITTLILRYSESYQESVKSTDATTTEQKHALVQQSMREMSEKIMSSDVERAKQFGMMTSLGRAFVIGNTLEGWYGDYDEADKFQVEFTETQEEAVKGNSDLLDDDSKLFVCVKSIDTMEFFNVSLELVQTIPTNQIPNIPIVDETGVIAASVPADKVATFPRTTRNLNVEDVRPDDSPADGDNTSGASA